MSESISEFATRRDKIDVFLSEAGWDIKNPTQIILEVDTLQSDFNARAYKTYSDTRNNDLDSKFADYLLLDAAGNPLAIIEAKKTSRDAILGRKQAELYVEDIKKQVGSDKDVFIYYSNGYEIWFWNKGHASPRAVKGFHTRDDLEKMRFQNSSYMPFSDTPIRPEITDRSYQIESIKRVLEGIDKGKRKFLIVQATGTGKTRVAMSIIDVLLRSRRAKRILFLADRITLRDQGYDDGFAPFFPNESKVKVVSGDIALVEEVADSEVTAKSSNAKAKPVAMAFSNLHKYRLYASTIQTFAECYKQFSVGYFDVIISDEAHRSIYNKWKDVFTYFDCLQIGLTATPANMIERDTFRYFDCEDGKPTALYTYEQAVQEGYLVDFKVHEAQTHFQIEGIKWKDIPQEIRDEFFYGSDSEDPNSPTEEDIVWEGKDIEKKVIVSGTNEKIIKEFYEYCLKDQAGNLPAKSIIFAVSQNHAKRLLEIFDRLYPEHKGELASIIVSGDSRAQHTLSDFKKKSKPRIAFSVDMLDTGVDVPEACNLVFAKPVFSKIKFWQMIGRGTRSNAACKNFEWLPDAKKTEFLIFDFWKNFEFFDMHPQGKISSPTDALPTKIFLVRLQQYSYFKRNGDNDNAKAILSKLVNAVENLPQDSASIREHLREVEIVTKGKLFESIVVSDEVEFLRTRIAPIMKYTKDVNLNRESFRYKTEQLALAILTNNKLEIDRLKEDIADYLVRLPLTIKAVKEKESVIDKVLSNEFWLSIRFEHAIWMQEELVEIMDNLRDEPVPKVELDIDDFIKERKMIQYGFPLKEDYIEAYKEKVEKFIRELALDSEAIEKLRSNRALTSTDIELLAKRLHGSELSINEANLAKVYNQRASLVDFIKHIIGLSKLPSPEDKIAEAFKTFIVEKNYLNSNQVNFMRILQTVFARKKHIELEDLYELPFTNLGSDVPIPLFSQQDLDEVVELCKKLEKEVF